jgi:hypothetical protein
MTGIFLSETITTLIEKRYDTKSASSFIKLMEALIKKLRALVKEHTDNFKYDDTILKKALAAVDKKIKDSKTNTKRNDVKIAVA